MDDERKAHNRKCLNYVLSILNESGYAVTAIDMDAAVSDEYYATYSNPLPIIIGSKIILTCSGMPECVREAIKNFNFTYDYEDYEDYDE